MNTLFTDDEYATRLVKVREVMDERGMDVCLVSVPENIFYLTGLTHQGYFTYHMLIIPREGQMTLITRGMEQFTIAEQVRNAVFVGYPDDANPAQFTANVLREQGVDAARIGLELNSMLLTVQIADALRESLPNANWSDASGIIEKIRYIKSEGELDYTRQAAAISDVMMQAAIDAARSGVTEQAIAAEIYHKMVTAGGEHPGFHPFVRSTPTLSQEHVGWTDRELQTGDMLFVELAGCVKRYHAPMGRLIFINEAPQETYTIQRVCLDALDNVLNRMKPGIRAHDVYRAWQDVVDRAGLSHYRRHHCGYLVGIGFPPSWTGGNTVIGLRENSDLVLEAGMVFHIMSWLMNSGAGDYFVSDTVIVTNDGAETLTTTPRTLHVV